MDGIIGFTTMFAGNFAPKGWAFCAGQVMNVSQNASLFSLLSNTYGGNGTTTFQLPDLQGRRVVGAGTGPGLSTYALGKSTGVESVALTMNQMPMHVHSLLITATQKGLEDTGNSDDPTAHYYAVVDSQTGYSATQNGAMKSYDVALVMENTGSDAPFEILPPYLAVNYIICLQGVFPSRN